MTPGWVWTDVKPRPNRESIPDGPVRSQSLYQLSYPAHRCPEGSRKLRFADYVTVAQNDDKDVSLTRRPLLPPGNTPGTHIC